MLSVIYDWNSIKWTLSILKSFYYIYEAVLTNFNPRYDDEMLFESKSFG